MKTIPLALIATVIAFTDVALAEGENAGRITGVCRESIRQGNRTTCDAIVPFTFQADGSARRYVMRLTAPRTHCSSVAYRVHATRASVQYGGTAPLAPGESSAVFAGSDLPAGPHTIWVSAIGVVGGCNGGSMHSWAADIEVR